MKRVAVYRNKVVQYKVLLEDVKEKLEISEKKQYGAMFYRGRIEITEFNPTSKYSPYKTKSFKFTTVHEDNYEDLKQAWTEVFPGDIQLTVYQEN